MRRLEILRMEQRTGMTRFPAGAAYRVAYVVIVRSIARDTWDVLNVFDVEAPEHEEDALNAARAYVVDVGERERALREA